MVSPGKAVDVSEQRWVPVWVWNKSSVIGWCGLAGGGLSTWPAGTICETQPRTCGRALPGGHPEFFIWSKFIPNLASGLEHFLHLSLLSSSGKWEHNTNPRNGSETQDTSFAMSLGSNLSFLLTSRVIWGMVFNLLSLSFFICQVRIRTGSKMK